MADSTTIVAYLALFAGVGVVFLFANLLIGYFVRAANPHEEKTEIYECGEPTIGSSFVQFDIRFYVVALLFIIFDVEVAFFFPWATVFGKSVHMMNEPEMVAAGELTPVGEGLLLEMGVANPSEAIATLADANSSLRRTGRALAQFSIIDIGVFFGVLLVGFAYVWKRGDLDWVRAISRQRTGQVERVISPDLIDEEPVLTA